MTAPVRYQSGRTIRERGRRQPLSNRTRFAPAGTFAYGPFADSCSAASIIVRCRGAARGDDADET